MIASATSPGAFRATMSGSRNGRSSRGAVRLAGATAALVLLVVAAIAQTPPQQPPQVIQAPPAPAAQPDANAAPQPQRGPGGGGFIDAFGHWIESSVGNWNSGFKGATDAAKDATDAAGNAAKGAADAATTMTRDTAGAVARLPGTRVIAERATCPTAPNGAPDCRSAAEAICKAHGFASGGSIDFQTAEKCPPVALNRPNAEPPPPCVLESYVTRALCQ
jgi:hypothetical protein